MFFLLGEFLRRCAGGLRLWRIPVTKNSVRGVEEVGRDRGRELPVSPGRMPLVSVSTGRMAVPLVPVSPGRMIPCQCLPKKFSPGRSVSVFVGVFTPNFLQDGPFLSSWESSPREETRSTTPIPTPEPTTESSTTPETPEWDLGDKNFEGRQPMQERYDGRIGTGGCFKYIQQGTCCIEARALPPPPPPPPPMVGPPLLGPPPPALAGGAGDAAPAGPSPAATPDEPASGPPTPPKEPTPEPTPPPTPPPPKEPTPAPSVATDDVSSTIHSSDSPSVQEKKKKKKKGKKKIKKMSAGKKMKLVAVKRKKGSGPPQKMVMKKGNDGELHKVSEKMFNTLTEQGKTEEQAVQEILDAIGSASVHPDAKYPSPPSTENWSSSYSPSVFVEDRVGGPRFVEEDFVNELRPWAGLEEREVVAREWAYLGLRARKVSSPPDIDGSKTRKKHRNPPILYSADPVSPKSPKPPPSAEPEKSDKKDDEAQAVAAAQRTAQRLFAAATEKTAARLFGRRLRWPNFGGGRSPPAPEQVVVSEEAHRYTDHWPVITGGHIEKEKKEPKVLLGNCRSRVHSVHLSLQITDVTNTIHLCTSVVSTSATCFYARITVETTDRGLFYLHLYERGNTNIESL